VRLAIKPGGVRAGTRLDRCSWSRVARKSLGVDLFRAREKLAAFFSSKVPSGDLGWCLGQLVLRMPVTRPGWFLLEPLDASEPAVVAFEDRQGLWWEYMPSSGKLHNIPWLSTDFHSEDRSGYVRKPLTGLEAQGLIARGVGRASDDPLAAGYENDRTARDPQTALP
jgi:hypothetical protein